MDLNLLTIARRADLGSQIVKSISNARNRIFQIENINNKVDSSSDFADTEKIQNREFTIIGTISVLEHLLNELLLNVLVSYPKTFGNKKFEIEELIEEGSILQLFHLKATQKLLDLAYGRFERFVDNFEKSLELTSALDKHLVETVNEIKCTRDCLLHSEGRTSDIYFEKTGQFARARNVKEKLVVDPAYIGNSINTIKKIIDAIHSSLPKKITDSNRSYIFKQMWEATCLNRLHKFDQVWSIVDGTMVRPKDIKNDYGFSSSELAVYNLFRHIFNSHDYKVDFSLLFQRWGAHTSEHQVATSWLNSQFYF
jgi:hypothetical protein